jgi:hypothetical protein
LEELTLVDVWNLDSQQCWTTSCCCFCCRSVLVAAATLS